MKRFSLIVSIAVCMLMLCGANAFANWGTFVESKTASENQTGVTLDFSCQNDLPMTGFTAPMVVRSTSGGAFWMGSLPFDTGGNAFVPGWSNGIVSGLNWDWAGMWAALLLEMRPGVPALPDCDPEGDTDYDGTSTDHFVLNGSGAGGSEPVHATPFKFLTIQFDVNGNAGTFEIDTACYTKSLGHIFMIDNVFPPGDHSGDGDFVFTKGVVTILPNECPTAWGSYSDQPGTEGDLLTADISSGYSDPEGDPANYYKVSGPGQVDLTTGDWSWQTGACDADGSIYTVVVEITDDAHGEGFCAGDVSSTTSFTVTVAPVNPTIDNCQNFTMHWTGTLNHTFTASGWGPFQWAGDGDAFSYTPGCALGIHNFSTTVTDSCGRTDVCDFEVEVTNEFITCVDLSTHFLFTDGYYEDLDATYSDPDGLIYSNLVITPTPPDNMPVLAGGVITWDPTDNDAQFNGGLYNICVDITDGCESITCCWDLTVQYTQPYKVSVLDPTGDPYPPDIPLEAHYVHVYSGMSATIGVHLKNGFIQGTGAFDLLLCYDQSMLSLVAGSVVKGDGIADWEYFTYRSGAFGQNCGSACPSGYLRLIAVRDMNNGVPQPAGSEFVNGFIAYMTFRVTEDRSFLNMCARIGFCSIDCGDNIISDITGNEIALAFPDQNDPEGYMITFGPDYDLEVCLEGFKGKNPASFIYFDPGYICIIPPEDDRGDINLNGIANEIGDAVLFTNYFIYGPSVWDPIWSENQILASDINDDGIVATVADLVYLIRIITGDAIPYGPSGEYKINPYANAMDVNTEMVDGNLVITTSSSTDLGAGHLVFHYTGLTVGAPETNTGLDVKSNAANGELRVLVYSMEHNTVGAGVTEFVTIPVEGNGTIELVNAEFSDEIGNLITVNTHRVAPPTAFELMQNYPNPFNASTQIRFALPVASNWSLNIYNVAGQIVETFAGSAEAGIVSVNWNADVASGIYFYKLDTKDFSATKKMVLMK